MKDAIFNGWNKEKKKLLGIRRDYFFDGKTGSEIYLMKKSSLTIYLILLIGLFFITNFISDIFLKSARVYFERGLSFAKKNLFSYAISNYNKSLQINPNFGIVYLYRAEAYFSNREYDKSLEDIFTAMGFGYDIGPGDFEALKKLSEKE